ncbi:MAG: hypothetical protein ABJC07_00135 [Acidobacteriota bacterium]
MSRIADQCGAVGEIRRGVTERALDAPKIARKVELLAQRAGNGCHALELAPEDGRCLFQEAFRAFSRQWKEQDTFPRWHWKECRRREPGRFAEADPHTGLVWQEEPSRDRSRDENNGEILQRDRNTESCPDDGASPVVAHDEARLERHGAGAAFPLDTADPAILVQQVLYGHTAMDLDVSGGDSCVGDDLPRRRRVCRERLDACRSELLARDPKPRFLIPDLDLFYRHAGSAPNCFADAQAVEPIERRSPQNLRTRDPQGDRLTFHNRHAPSAAPELERKHGAADARTNNDDVKAQESSVASDLGDELEAGMVGLLLISSPLEAAGCADRFLREASRDRRAF